MNHIKSFSQALNDKTEFLLVGSRQQLAKVSIDSVSVRGDCNISLSPAIRNLGTWFDGHLYMQVVNITKTCSNAFYYLYNIRHIRKYLSRSSTETLAHAFITSDSTTGARLIYYAPKSCHITPLLRELHWLPVCYRIEYKIILLTFKVLHGMAPDYLCHLIYVLLPSKYNLRHNHDPGVLLTPPKVRTKMTLDDRSFSCADPNFRICFHLPFGPFI